MQVEDKYFFIKFTFQKKEYLIQEVADSEI
jgi:hypothetical protein